MSTSWRLKAGGAGGFSLLEAVVAMALGLVLLASVLTAWYFTTREWKAEHGVSALRYDMNAAMERMKQDAKLADSSKILFYPADSSSYTAISLPQATASGSGLFSFSGGAIAWDKTVLYHVYQNGDRQELRRTVYSTFNSNPTTRQAALDSTVESGTGGAGSTTETLLSADSVALEFNSSTPVFDGYSPTTEVSELSDFGSIRIAAGTHEVKFLVTGRNASSSGYRVGIDSIRITPSGGSREAEELTISATSGDTASSVDMSAFSGSWGGNYQVEYTANAVSDYLTFLVSYDEWLESNFANMTHNNSVVTTTGNPVLTLSSRETQGLVPSWRPDLQTDGASPQDEPAISDRSVRTVVRGALMSRGSDMIRIKFQASSVLPLVIQGAYFGVHAGGGDYSTAPILLYFDNAPQTEGSVDPTGELAPGTQTSVTIGAGQYVWSNWFEYAIDPSTAPDFLVSYYVPSGSGIQWDDTTTLPAPENSYEVDGNHASETGDWSLLTNYASGSQVRGVAAVAAWQKTAVATSQVYDTKITSPSYGQISWDSSLPGGSTASFKVRTSANSSMVGATDWSLLATRSSSPSSLTSLPGDRYVQFQATLQSTSPYTSFPHVDNVAIDWPGQTTFVTIGGRFTRSPNYGIFQVLIDDTALVKAMTIRLSAETEYRSQTYTETLQAEVKAKNTGK